MLRSDARCRSIVAVLTLEVTGVPAHVPEDRFLPSFARPANRHSFEVSIAAHPIRTGCTLDSELI